MNGYIEMSELNLNISNNWKNEVFNVVKFNKIEDENT